MAWTEHWLDKKTSSSDPQLYKKLDCSARIMIVHIVPGEGKKAKKMGKPARTKMLLLSPSLVYWGIGKSEIKSNNFIFLLIFVFFAAVAHCSNA